MACHGQDSSNVSLPISSPFRVTIIQDSQPFVFLSLITPRYLYSWNSKDKTPWISFLFWVSCPAKAWKHLRWTNEQLISQNIFLDCESLEYCPQFIQLERNGFVYWTALSICAGYLGAPWASWRRRVAISEPKAGVMSKLQWRYSGFTAGKVRLESGQLIKGR